MTQNKIVTGLQQAIAHAKGEGTGARVTTYFATGSSVDAAIFRDLLDAIFHNCPMNAEGHLELNDYAAACWDTLSKHTYRDGKEGIIAARLLLERHR